MMFGILKEAGKEDEDEEQNSIRKLKSTFNVIDLA